MLFFWLCGFVFVFFFFFKQKTAYEIVDCDWSSDVCSSDLKESDVQKMSAQEYEKNSDEIMEAIRSGKFVYDVSGSAR